MNRGLYAAGSGMSADTRWLEVLSNNLANASTTGFKREGIAFSEAFEREVRAGFGEGPPIGRLGAGPTDAGRYTVFEQGNLIETSNPLDVAIVGNEGLFAVRTPQGVAYTRAGTFDLDTNRRLVTHDGHAVLDVEGREIVLPQGNNVAIDQNGAVTVDDLPAGQIGIVRGQFERVGYGLYRGQNVTIDPAPNLRAKTIEASNVEPVSTMIELINLTRHFEIGQKAIQSQDEMTQRLIQSLSE